MLIEGRTVEEIFEAMLEVVKSTHDGYQQLVIVGICLLVLFFISKKDRTRLCLPVLLITILLFIPQLYIYIYEATSYKRFFWLLPDAVLVCYVSVLLISKIKKVWLKTIASCSVCLMLFLSGNSIYSEESGFFVKAENMQKVDASTKELVDMIIAIDTEPTCIFPSSVSVMSRVYNADIIQCYGRNAYGYTGPIDPVLIKVSYNLNTSAPDADYVFSTAKSKGVKFVVTYDSSIIDIQICEKYGYNLCSNVAGYNIYYNSNPTGDISEWYVTQYGPDWGKCTLYTIEDTAGNLVIIDGGYSGNANLIRTIISKHNYHVSAWIITNISSPHAGAIYDILNENGNQITIDNIYIQNYTNDMMNIVINNQMEWEGNDLEKAEELIDLVNMTDNVTYVNAGEEYDVLGLKLHIYHVWDSSVESVENREASNSSMVFSIEGDEDSMLFMSYVTLPIQNDVISQIGDTQFDYITVNDHGEWTFDYWWYESLSPTAFFIDEDSNKLVLGGFAYPFYSYFSEKGYNIYTFATVPNRITIR